MTFVLFRAKICINYSAKLLLNCGMRKKKGGVFEFFCRKKLKVESLMLKV